MMTAPTGWITGNYFANIDADNTAIDVFSNANLNEHGIIANNYIKNNGANQDIFIGIGNSGPIADIIVMGNQLDGGGMLVGSGAGGVSNIQIVGNLFADGGSIGILVEQYATGTSIVNNSIRGSQLMGISIPANTSDVAIRGNFIYNNGQDTGAAAGNRMGVVVRGSDVQISGNTVFDDQGSPTQLYGVDIRNSTNPLVTNNAFSGHATSDDVLVSGASGALVNHNLGYLTENHGAAGSVADGGTIAHGLDATPTVAVCNPSVGSEFVSVTGLDGTNITVAIKKDDGTAGTSQTIYWRAYV